jgi:hypothetical protein
VSGRWILFFLKRDIIFFPPESVGGSAEEEGVRLTLMPWIRRRSSSPISGIRIPTLSSFPRPLSPLRRGSRRTTSGTPLPLFNRFNPFPIPPSPSRSATLSGRWARSEKRSTSSPARGGGEEMEKEAMGGTNHPASSPPQRMSQPPREREMRSPEVHLLSSPLSPPLRRSGYYSLRLIVRMHSVCFFYFKCGDSRL